MKFTIITLGFLSLLLLGCNNQKMINKISGVWIFDNEINNLYLNNTTDFFPTQRPIIFDFQTNKKLQIKNYSYKDTLFSWSFKTDSILKFNKHEYKIHTLDSNNLTLIDYSRPDTFWLFFKKPKNVNIELSKNEISEILISNSWTIQDTTNKRWDTNFEYFNNGTVTYRYKIFDRNFEDTLDNLQLETWGVAAYKNYFFLYGYMDMMLGNGNTDRINQIIDISPKSYTITETIDKKISEIKYISKNQKDNRPIAIEKLKGNWISKNSREKTYGKSIPKRAIENGIIALFEGDLLLNIYDKQLSFQIDTLNPFKYNWQLSKDGRILILEYQIDEPEIKGIHVAYADILELTDDKMKIRLFENNFYTGLENPERYLLNLIQEFEKRK